MFDPRSQPGPSWALLGVSVAARIRVSPASRVRFSLFCVYDFVLHVCRRIVCVQTTHVQMTIDIFFTRNRPLLIILVAALCASQALAQATHAELFAQRAGRIVGAAMVCGIEAARLGRIGDRISDVVSATVSSRVEQSRATNLFISGYEVGFNEVETKKTACAAVSADLLWLENELVEVK